MATFGNVSYLYVPGLSRARAQSSFALEPGPGPRRAARGRLDDAGLEEKVGGQEERGARPVPVQDWLIRRPSRDYGDAAII